MKLKEMTKQERLDRLWGHLLELERQTGGKLLKRPRAYPSHTCPIANFAPRRDRQGNIIIRAFDEGSVQYNKEQYKIYEPEDSVWWRGLFPQERLEVSKWIMKKIKER